MARSSKIQRLLGPDWSIKFMKADGDCYYAAISAALENDFTVQALRDVVADACTEETLTMMRLAQRTGCGSPTICAKIGGVEELKRRIRVTGGNTSAGQCVWACDFSIQTVAEHLGLAVLILDEAGAWGSQCVSILRTRRRTASSASSARGASTTTCWSAARRRSSTRRTRTSRALALAAGRRLRSGGGGDAPAGGGRARGEAPATVGAA
ncbi:hypothetical protein SO694_0001612 [Aureococcus anophagefferens]|uniref:OTU domain-containing protein n=1 Tax=Aureococcus anophagefferens TaxID=44056 RepID=A0ABR1G340_AURAN